MSVFMDDFPFFRFLAGEYKKPRNSRKNYGAGGGFSVLDCGSREPLLAALGVRNLKPRKSAFVQRFFARCRTGPFQALKPLTRKGFRLRHLFCCRHLANHVSFETKQRFSPFSWEVLRLRKIAQKYAVDAFSCGAGLMMRRLN